MTPRTLLAAAAVAALASACAETPSTAPKPAATKGAAAADAAAPPRIAIYAAVNPVTTGVVVRGVNATVPAGGVGNPGTASGRTCDFSREETDQTKAMNGASVQCRPGGTLEQALANLPATFNSYCSVDAGKLGGRLIAAPLKDNAQHCDLSGIKANDAQSRFGGAKWR
jgi:hypothetical protein